MTLRPLRFGIWALVHGPRAAHQDPEEPYDASWERNRDLVLAAERLGYDSTLVAQHTIFLSQMAKMQHDFEEIKALLLHHQRILQDLPEAIKRTIGFRTK